MKSNESIASVPSLQSKNESCHYALAEVAQIVKKRGDMLDRLRWLKTSPRIGAIAYQGAALTGMQIGSGIDINTFPKSALVLAGGTLVATNLTHPLVRKRRQLKAQEPLAALTTLGEYFGGDSVEIYRQETMVAEPKKHKWIPAAKKQVFKLHLLWEPSSQRTESLDEVANSMLELSNSAKENNIAAVVVPLSAFASAKDLLPETVTMQSRMNWLFAIKRISVEDIKNQEDKLCIFTPDMLEEFAERLTSIEVDPLKAYMDILQTLRPRHASLRAYNNGSTNLRALERSLRQSVEARLQMVDTKVERTPNGAQTKSKTFASGKIDIHPRRHTGGMVQWMSSEGKITGETTNLLRHYGLSFENLETFPISYRHMPKPRALEICEIAAWLAAYDELHSQYPNQLLPPQKALEAATFESVSKEPIRGMQRRITDRTLLKRPPLDAQERTGISFKHLSRERMAVSAAILGGLAFTSAMGVALMNRYALDYVKRNIDRNTPDHIDWSVYAHKPLALKAQQADGKWYFQLAAAPLEGSRRFELLVDSATKKLRNIGMNDPKEPKIFDPGNVGNAEGTPNQPVWFIESHNGMSSKGYWAQSSANVLEEDPLSWQAYSAEDESRFISAAKDSTALNTFLHTNLLPLPNSLDKEVPTLKVRRSFDGSSPRDSVMNFQIGKNEVTQISVPVLKGTRVIAASLNGNTPVKSMRLENGTTVFLLAGDDSKPFELEYFLSTASQPESVHAITKVSDYNSGKLLKPLNDLWRTRIAGFNNLDYWERVEKEKEYIEQTFQYRLQPLENSNDLTNEHSYAEAVLKDKKANCNVANTLLALSTPGGLNYVTGYLNSNTKEQVSKNAMHLSSNELHAWTVDVAGSIRDATPSSGITKKDEAALKENYAESFSDSANKKDEENMLLFYGLGGLAAAGIIGGIYAGRKRLGYFALRARLTYINPPTSAESQMSYDLINQAIYAGSELDESRYQEAKQRSTQRQKGMNQQWQNFAAKHDPKKVKPIIKQKVKSTSSPEVGAALRQGLRLHRLYYNSQK